MPIFRPIGVTDFLPQFGLPFEPARLFAHGDISRPPHVCGMAARRWCHM